MAAERLLSLKRCVLFVYVKFGRCGCVVAQPDNESFQTLTECDTVQYQKGKSGLMRGWWRSDGGGESGRQGQGFEQEKKAQKCHLHSAVAVAQAVVF